MPAIQTLHFPRMGRPESDLQHARRRLSEGLERLREQAEFVDRLAADGQPTEVALDLLKSMQATVEEMQTHLRFLIETSGRQG